ncbi:MAG: PQQ-binding-like beta-propeller repeat protein [Arcicella sp.]|nr:PQQ-binding-like beta-propeller repeat protein [Arcicella sp.]
MIKYNLIETIQNTLIRVISDRYVVSKKIIFKNSKWIDSLILINNIVFEEDIKTSRPNFNGVGIFKNKLYYTNDVFKGKSYVIDLVENRQYEFIKNDYIGFVGSYKDMILIENLTEKIESNYEIIDRGFISLVNPDTLETVWSNTKRFDSDFLSDEKSLYVVNGYEIRCLDANTGIEKWSFPVNELGKYKPNNNYEGIKQGRVNGLIAIHQGVLIAQITDYKILGIDTNTGKKKWIINDFRKSLPQEIYKIVKPMTTGDTSVGDIANWHLIPETNKMYLTWFSFVFELDIITKEVNIIFNAFPEMTLGRSIRIENLIYVLGVNDNYLHIFDIEKREIIWSFVHPNETYINDISIHKDKVYLKDWNDNLLILEREKL